MFKCDDCEKKIDDEEVAVIEEEYGICLDCIRERKEAEKYSAWDNYPCCGGIGCKHCLCTEW